MLAPSNIPALPLPLTLHFTMQGEVRAAGGARVEAERLLEQAREIQRR